jgi:hypothetical protein
MGGPIAMVAVAAALALPAGAPAATTTLKGKLEDGGRVAFELKRKANGSRQIVRWRWHDLPVECADGSHAHDGKFKPPWLAVTGRSFYEMAVLDEQGRSGFAEVEGSFPRTWKRARGTLQVSGDTVEWDDCESGVVKWTAKRV